MGNYIVRRGDTLSGIGREHGVAWQELAKLNRLGEPYLLQPGQVLDIPDAEQPAPAAATRTNEAVHVIGAGETLGEIARRYGVSVDSLVEANGIADRNLVPAGLTVKIPGAAPQASPAPGKIAASVPASEDWAALIAAHGDAEAKSDFAAGRRVVIALRHPTRTDANSGRGRYDDEMIVVCREGGKLKVSRFLGNTEPSRQYGPEAAPKKRMGRNVGGDARIDQGRLMEGCYRYIQDGMKYGEPCFRSRDVQPAERDTNQDKTFTAADPNRIDPRGAGKTMLVHRGAEDNTWSAGCQTLPRSRYKGFIKALNRQSAFSYILRNLPG
ncbi:MAG TPA: LysM peptidoglycan-binding domain-containing protein [Allosphingosinicella sp.]|nr:LysM peptidoglycan-binding domain-containing protein [Allosphingosinicella sp.]